MNEDEFELNGKTYVSVKSKSKPACYGCYGCALFYGAFSCISDNHPKCIGKARQDGRNVIFVEKQQ